MGHSLDRSNSSIARFLLSTESERNTTPLQTLVSVVALYTVVIVTLIAAPLNTIEDLRAGLIGTAIAQMSFLVCVLAALVCFWITRRLPIPRAIIGTATFGIITYLVIIGGGTRGLGLLYFVAGYSVLFHIVGYVAAVALPVLLFAGMLIRSAFGNYPPGSYFSDPVFAKLYITLLGVAGAISIVSLLYQRKMVRHLAAQAYVDEVTGLSNRNRFEEQLRETIAGRKRFPDAFGLIAIKLYRFSRVNSYFGPVRSDLLLRQIADRLSATLPPGSLLARYTGTLFLVMAPPHSFEDLEDLARSLHSIGNRSYKIDTSTATVEANVAVTRFPEDGHSPERLIANLMATVSRRSDKGGSISFFNEVSYRAENQKYSIREQLRTAIERNELSLVYHPIVRINSGEALGAEVLLRWNNERFGPVSPGLFIPLAEEMGITTEITLWVMESASSELQRLRERSGGAEHYVHSLNLSPLDLAEPRFVPSVEQWISRSGIDPTLFELEITEGIVLDQNPRVGESLQRLRNLGFKLAMDDFGTGYSNLRYLNELHLTTVKIDQSFVRQINCHGEFSPVVEAIISMADSFGLRVTAEGVETAEQADYLTRAGCDTAQGYLYTKPLPIDDYASWLLASSPARV